MSTLLLWRLIIIRLSLVCFGEERYCRLSVLVVVVVGGRCYRSKRN